MEAEDNSKMDKLKNLEKNINKNVYVPVQPKAISIKVETSTGNVMLTINGTTLIMDFQDYTQLRTFILQNMGMPTSQEKVDSPKTTLEPTTEQNIEIVAEGNGQDVAEDILGKITEEAKKDQIMKQVEGAKEVADILDKQTPEERDKIVAEAHKKAMEKQFEELGKFEKTLLGEVKAEVAPTVDYSRLRDLFTTKGADALNEELSKFPENVQNDIVDKILTEFSDKV